MSTVYLVRHADAVDAARWGEAGAERPLTPRGLRQAAALVRHLDLRGRAKVLSSPARRCLDTVRPTASAIRAVVQVEAVCAEGTPGAVLLDVLIALDADVVACSHGDVIGDVVGHLIERGLADTDARCDKASTWRLTTAEGTLTGADYVEPPGG